VLHGSEVGCWGGPVRAGRATTGARRFTWKPQALDISRGCSSGRGSDTMPVWWSNAGLAHQSGAEIWNNTAFVSAASKAPSSCVMILDAAPGTWIGSSKARMHQDKKALKRLVDNGTKFSLGEGKRVRVSRQSKTAHLTGEPFWARKKRVTGFEPATHCLGSSCATTALHPRT
jgi:hypothetical protein